MFFSLGFVFMFNIGWLSWVVLANASLDIAFHDNYYVIAHFHYGFTDLLQGLLNRAYTSLEWYLNSPPKLHAFLSKIQ